MATGSAKRELLDVVITTRIERSLRDDIQALADTAEREFAQEVRRALRHYVMSQTLIESVDGEAA